MASLDLFEKSWQDVWAGANREAPVGAVFTKREVVDLILDLAQYSVAEGRLAQRRLLEPSCGDGAFLSAIVERLIASEAQHPGALGWLDLVLDDAIRAVDISEESLRRARSAIVSQLKAAGCPGARAKGLAAQWVVHSDFLLHSWNERFDVVVGNPPYVRIEDLPRRVLQRYRERFKTSSDRADLYIAFFERGLELLSANGVLAFICANRFTKNAYGAALRRYIAASYRVRFYLNLEHTQPFETDVSAYPAIIVIDRHLGSPTLASTLHDLASHTLKALRADVAAGHGSNGVLSEFATWYPGGGPWLATSSSEQRWLDRAVARYPTLEASGLETHVGIGVATGADSVFVLPQKHPEIEESRQIPLLMAGDIANSDLTWSGHYLINPFADVDDGSLADLSRYPVLARYLEEHRSSLVRRHVAKSRPVSWYRTIDRIWPQLVPVRKLVIPDIQSNATIGLDEGHYYPHHNVYFITSDSWDLRALKAVLRSEAVLRQVRALSVQMRGGSLRFQAQTLRRLRIPQPALLSSADIQNLADCAESADQQVIDAVVGEVFARHL
jgi:hypothetical protein